MRKLYLLPAVLVLVGSLQAQTFRGGIEGTVTDTTGAAVAGVQVTVTNTGTGLERSAVTVNAGAKIDRITPRERSDAAE